MTNTKLLDALQVLVKQKTAQAARAKSLANDYTGSLLGTETEAKRRAYANYREAYNSLAFAEELQAIIDAHKTPES